MTTRSRSVIEAASRIPRLCRVRTIGGGRGSRGPLVDRGSGESRGTGGGRGEDALPTREVETRARSSAPLIDNPPPSLDEESSTAIEIHLGAFASL
jgi:hypothetical protein